MQGKKLVVLFALVILFCLFYSVGAQQAEVRAILDEINLRRLQGDLTPLALNDGLSRMAAEKFLSVYINERSCVGTYADRSGIDSIGEDSKKFFADYQIDSNSVYYSFAASWSYNGQTPQNAILGWQNSDDSTLRNYYNLLLDSKYREIGIAYRGLSSDNRQCYVIILAAQPNIFPASLVQLTDGGQFETFYSDERIEKLQDKYIYIGNQSVSNDEIRVSIVRISNQEPNPNWECPKASLPSSWLNYSYRFPLEGLDIQWESEAGFTNLYIQMCDQSRNKIRSPQPVQILYVGDLSDQVVTLAPPTPVYLGIQPTPNPSDVTSTNMPPSDSDNQLGSILLLVILVLSLLGIVVIVIVGMVKRSFAPKTPIAYEQPIPKVFISYRRSISSNLANAIVDELREKYNIDAYLDVKQQDGPMSFPKHLLRTISQRDVFVCVVGETTFESEWVKREIQHAYNIGTPMIPVFHEGYIHPAIVTDDYIKALLDSQGIEILDKRNKYITEGIRDLAEMIRQPRR